MHRQKMAQQVIRTTSTLINSVSPHDQIIVLGDFNAVTGTDRTGFENVVGNYGSGTVNDNSSGLLTMCSSTNLTVLGLWFKRKNIFCHTWLSNDDHTQKKVDHILSNNRTMFKSLRVHRGAEAPANTDHRLVIAKTRSLHLMRVIKPQVRKTLDVEALTRDDDLTNKYNYI